jgi:hypothetical protein
MIVIQLRIRHAHPESLRFKILVVSLSSYKGDEGISTHSKFNASRARLELQ